MFGEFELHPARRVLLEAGRPIRLGGRSFDILVALAERAGEVVSKADLIERVWPTTTVDDANLRVHVAALRKVLGDGHSGRRFIANVPGRGYSLVAEVSAAPAPAEAPPEAPAAWRLPALLTRLVGREAEIQALLGQLGQQRLVTLVGPGGIGKTTIALAAADALSATFQDGAVFVDLAAVTAPSLVPGALAAALGLAVRAEDPSVALDAVLRDRRLLIVLDNCEHVAGAAAMLAERVLRLAPGLRILATSTEPLRATGEWVQRIQPLGFPRSTAGITAAEALAHPAVQLFVERAAATLGGYELTEAEAPAVAEICRRLDGMALAIELAAGWVDTFRPRELLALLADRFRLLTRGRRSALPRHRTLLATLEWSYGQLTPAEQAMLRRLAVFQAGFTLGAAAEVMPGGVAAAPQAGELLASLVNKSLVVAEGGEAEVRYRLFDTTRSFALERLQQAGEAEETLRSHARHAHAVFLQAEAEWETLPTAPWLARYDWRIGDLHAALDWAFSPAGDIRLGVEMTVAAVPLWCQLSLMDEGLARVQRALAAPGGEQALDDRRRTRLHAALGWLQMYAAGRLDSSTAAWRTALALAERQGDVDYQLRALWALWAERQYHGAFRESRALAGRFRALAETAASEGDRLVGDRMIGTSEHFLGDQRGARAQLEAMLARYVSPLRRSDAVRFQFDQRVTARHILARVLWLQGFPDRALREIEGNLAEAHEVGHILSLCNALVHSVVPVALLAGDLAAASRHTALLRRHATEQALDIWHSYVACFEGEILVQRGEPEAGLRLLRPAVDALRAANFVQYVTAFLAAVARGQAAAGRHADALATIGAALERCAGTGEAWCLPELLRLKAEALRAAAPDGAGEAEALLGEALALARRQGARAWELRVATSLAAFLAAGGRVTEGRALLVPVRGTFTEGFALRDLRQADAVLRRLEGAG